tara:strand:+ start:2989 stop:4827 length:1839 start_codon:yes stop_codon:yes gene_type:complete
MGAGDLYSTLDEAPDWAVASPQKLREFAFPQPEAVGFVLSGGLAHQGESGYWGRETRLDTGERLQMRFHPKGTEGKPLEEGETRLLAFRRCAADMQTIVGFAVLFLPRDVENPEDFRDSAYGHTLGCRFMQVVLPSLISKHDAKCKRPAQLLNVSPSGYRTIRSYVYSVASDIVIKKHNMAVKDTRITVAPGLGYFVVAGHMAGIDVPDPLQQSHVLISPSEFYISIGTLQNLLFKRIGKESTSKYTSSAFSIMEALSAEGLLAMRAHPFFKGAKPESMHSPLGVSLLIAVASRIAMSHSHFGLRAPTKTDAYANLQIGTMFNSRWTAIGDREFRAIDVVIHRSHEAALRHCEEENGKHLRVVLDGNLVLLQRAGQRTNTRLMSEDARDALRKNMEAKETRFGRADLVDDCISDAKYEYFQQNGVGQPLAELRVNTLLSASRADMRMQLYRVQDEVELWLREGTYDGVRITDANKCPVTGEECDCISDGKHAKSEAHLNKSAMDSAVNATTALFIHGSSLFNQLGVNCFLVGPGCRAKCSDCSALVESLQTEILGSTGGSCIFCNAKRCFSCSRAALERGQSMMRCGACKGSPGSPGSLQTDTKSSKKKNRG